MRPLQGEGLHGKLDDVLGVRRDLPGAGHPVGVVVGELGAGERAPPLPQDHRAARCNVTRITVTGINVTGINVTSITVTHRTAAT